MAALQWAPGRVARGHGVASGRSAGSPYPAGAIALQAPFFAQHGVDLSRYCPGTLNVDVAPLQPIPSSPVFDRRLRWLGGIEERFLLTLVALRSDAGSFEGLWYYLHPVTKPAHQQLPSVVELLLPWVQGLAPGAGVAVGLAADALGPAGPAPQPPRPEWPCDRLARMKAVARLRSSSRAGVCANRWPRRACPRVRCAPVRRRSASA